MLFDVFFKVHETKFTVESQEMGETQHFLAPPPTDV